MQKWIVVVVLLAAVLLSPFQATAQQQSFEVKVTNLTTNLVFTPILVASHRSGMKLFYPGQPASTELATLAEAGNVAPLMALLAADPDVRDVASSGAVLPPGNSVTVTVGTLGQFDHVSVASMLIPTNDAFFAVNGVEGPQRVAPGVPFRGTVLPNQKKTITVMVPAYDAGSEVNDEMCASIPGPPMVCQGEGVSDPAESDEGFVHIHRGIHGIGDLAPETYDWRNPVARVTIRRLP